MTARNLRCLTVAFALLISALIAAAAQACTSCGTPAVSYYQPATYTASYAPSYAYSGWYPGYWMDRWSARVWGARAYTTAYQPAYAVQPAYTAGYASYATSYAPSYASYAPSHSGCSSCASHTVGYAPYASCSSCATQQVTMMPVVSSGCDPCGTACGCTSCGSSGVTQAAYIQSNVPPAAGCSSCGETAATSSTTFVPVPHNAAPIQGAPQGTQQGGQQQLEPTEAPAIPQNQPVAPDRTDVQKPADSSVQPPPPANGAPGQSGDQSGSTEGKADENNANFIAPPLLLFNPQDKTARMPARSAAPVTVAVYERPIASSPASAKVSSKPITWQQAQQDAVGWTSASR